jgi:hypothetical protein
MTIPILALVVSSAALLISLASFYWANLRDRKSLKLVRVNHFTGLIGPSFALVNSGTRNVILTSIRIGFRDHDRTRRSYPELKLHADPRGKSQLAAGESVHYSALFPPEGLGSEISTGGKELSGYINNEPVFTKETCVSVGWVDSKGLAHSAEGYIFEFGFNKSGAVCCQSPLEETVELYGKSM